MDHLIDDSDRLKPCPFCGGEAEFGEVPHSEPKDFGARFIECLNPMCRATTALVFGEDAAANLLERWNKRTAPTPQQVSDYLAMVESIKGHNAS